MVIPIVYIFWFLLIMFVCELEETNFLHDYFYICFDIIWWKLKLLFFNLKTTTTTTYLLFYIRVGINSSLSAFRRNFLFYVNFYVRFIHMSRVKYITFSIIRSSVVNIYKENLTYVFLCRCRYKIQFFLPFHPYFYIIFLYINLVKYILELVRGTNIIYLSNS